MKKKVLKKQCTYNFILMRDDGSVRSMRVKNTTLRFLFTLFLLLVLGGAGGLAVGYHYFDVTQEYKANKQELAEIKAKLNQVTNYEKLAEVTAAPPTPLVKNDPVPAVESAEPENNAFPFNGTALSALQPERNATAVTFNATGETLDEEDTLPAIDSEASPLRINNFATRATANSGMRLRYELLSFPQERMVRGTVAYAAKLNDGKIVELSVKSAEDAYFSISRMKPFDFGISFPQDVSPRNVEGIVITLNVDNGGVFQGIFPVSR